MATVARVDAAFVSGNGAGAMSRDRAARRTSGWGTAAMLDRERSLSMLIQGEIIPRLMIAHGSDIQTDDPGRDTDAAVAADDVETLAPLALKVDAGALLAHVERVLARGVPVDVVMVELLAPTARLLGIWWEEDRCDFVDVTMGLWRLQEVVHEIAARAPAERALAAGGRRALFASMPGDQHDFGTVVLDEIFRRDGWVTDRLSGADTSELIARVGGGWFDLVGLTVSCDRHIAPLPSVIAALRNVSRNPRLCVMVGGRIFSAEPALAIRVGADGTAGNAQLALKVAADLVRVREGAGLVA